MKNVIYINCPGNPWIKVAKTLKEKYGYQPVYWIGSPEEDPDLLGVKKEFPNVIFHNSVDAWKGRFPKDIQELAVNTYIDVDFLKRHAHEELQAIKMMDRMDQDQRSFNFMERQRHFRNMLRAMVSLIEIVKPDLVINSAIPHRLYDYVLFQLCTDLNITYLTISHTQFPERFFFTKNNFYSIGELFVEDWNRFKVLDDIKNSVPKDILERFDAVKLDYCKAAPSYMEKDAIRQKKSEMPFFMTRLTLRKFFTKYRPYIFGKKAGPGIISHCAYDKKAGKKYEESEGNIYQHELMLRKANRIKKKLKNTYESLCTNPDYSETFVTLYLHYQPEATTCPGGDIYVDQRLCVDTLLKNLPLSYKVYVREHPHQFIKYRIGHTAKMCDLYEDLAKIKRVRLISTEIDSFDLMNNTKAVCTISGTVGWEAMVRQKPVISFGISWYENYKDGVLRINDSQSAKKIHSFIEDYQYNEKSLLAYLASIGKNTTLAGYWLGRVNSDKVTVQESVNNITNAIVEKIGLR